MEKYELLRLLNLKIDSPIPYKAMIEEFNDGLYHVRDGSRIVVACLRSRHGNDYYNKIKNHKTCLGDNWNIHGVNHDENYGLVYFVATKNKRKL